MSAPPTATHRDRKIRVWDLPTRLFHWLLLACVAGLFATAYAPGSWIEVHARLGYAVLALLLFRLAWGFLGGHWTRFSSFVPRAGQAAALGHTGRGALAVVVMLTALFGQVATGLVGDDEIAFTGPLNRFISTDLGLAATSWHAGAGQWVLVGLIALHLLAILFYLVVRRNNLIGSMVHGDRQVPEPPQDTGAQSIVSSVDTARSRLLALVVFALCAGAVFFLVA